MGRATLANIIGKDFSKLAKESKINTEEDTIEVSNSIKNKNTTSSDSRVKKSRRRNKKKTMPDAVVVSSVQKLFDTCKDVFALAGTGIVPTPDKIEKLRAVLGMFLIVVLLDHRRG